MQGFNMGRYVPPDVEGTISGNALHGKHALGARASKLRTEGILTVRFEMPFGVWCSTCAKPTIIGQGVRFNAEKKKVGAYYSTPIWSFRMRHTACGGVIEIRTDPANAEYVVTEGGTRRDTGEDKDGDDSLVTSRSLLGVGGLGEIITPKEHDALRNNAFAHLEKTIEDRGVLIERAHRIAELEDASHRAWEDPYAQNRRLRTAFRAGRKAREKEAASTEELQERMSLGIDLVPATEEDARRAALVDFGVAAALESVNTEGGSEARTKINDTALAKPLFASPATSSGGQNSTQTLTSKLHMNSNTADADTDNKIGGKKRLKSELKASRTRESLVSTITRNTRVSHDPFLISSSTVSEPGGGEGSLSKTPSRIQGIKRKRPEAQPSPSPATPKSAPPDRLTEAEANNTQGSLEDVPEQEKGRIKGPALTGAKIPPDDVDEEAKGPAKTGLALVEYDSD
ncbi:CWC16 protein [Nemania sp. FL0916]|nr:CWC16 protein [Nemania sp. FL0916]